MAAKKEVRPLRICHVCGGADDHPRHVMASELGGQVDSAKLVVAIINNADLTEDQKVQLAASLSDTSTQTRHMDCCREAGCPDGSCDALAASGAADLRGEALLKHLLTIKTK